MSETRRPVPPPCPAARRSGNAAPNVAGAEAPEARNVAGFGARLGDGALLRLLLPNRHQVAPGVWRSGQPGPAQLGAFARAGGRTVISLRAGARVAALPLEVETCQALGLAFHRLPLRGHRLPDRDELAAAARLFATVERPVLMHCHSGADRAGLAAALWLMLVEHRPASEARRQLSPRYGHNPLGRAGLLGAFLDACAAAEPMPFERWVATAYDPEAIAAAWRAMPLGARLRRWLARP